MLPHLKEVQQPVCKVHEHYASCFPYACIQIVVKVLDIYDEVVEKLPSWAKTKVGLLWKQTAHLNDVFCVMEYPKIVTILG